MKKLVAWLLAASMLLLFAACAAEESGTAISGALPEILDRIYDTAQVDDETRDFLKTGLVTTDLPPEALGEGLGIEEMPKADVVASEPTAEGVPFFACLLRMPGGTDVEAFKTELFDAAASCVEHSGVQDMCVESAGNLVLLVVAENAEKYSEAFFALAE